MAGKFRYYRITIYAGKMVLGCLCPALTDGYPIPPPKNGARGPQFLFDSCWIRNQAIQDRRHSGSPSYRAALPGSGRGPRPGAVSYTHLRAHETDSYLV